MEKFCDVLDRLPLKFTFHISNISKEIDGYWVKEHSKYKELDKEGGHYVWHNKTNDRYSLSSSFFAYKEGVLNAIKKGSNVYNKVKRNLTKEELTELYYEQIKSLEDIAEEYGYSRMDIFKIMKEYRLVRRTQSKARIEAIKKGKFEKFEYYDINENFFSVWSPEMAWVLGLLFTDGNVSPGRVSLSSVDIELLEKAKKLLNSTKPLVKQVQSYDKSKYVYRFEFCREKMSKDLNWLGLHERKSLNMIFPNVPEEYVRQFIRGCWDGDGSIFISGGKLRGSYVCGSLKFIEGLVQGFYKVGIQKRKPPLEKTETDKMLLRYPDGRFPLAIHKSKRSKSYEIKIDSRENLEKLFDYFYDRVDESMYLERKFKTFAEGLGVINNGLREI